VAKLNPFPAEAGRLDPASRAFLWAFRHWIVGHSDERHWSLVWRALESESGRVAAGDGVTALAAVVRAICEHARRNFTYHHPGCPCLAADEYRLVAFLEACRRGDWTVANGLAEWMVVADGVADLVAAGTLLTRATPAFDCDDAPDCLDDAEGPGALQESIHGSQRAGRGEAEHEPRAPLLECVTDDHRRDGEQAEGA
jgi:hypothetical protein